MKIFEDAVDGRNQVNSPVDRYIVYPFIRVYPIIFPGFVHLRWLFGISSIKSRMMLFKSTRVAVQLILRRKQGKLKHSM